MPRLFALLLAFASHASAEVAPPPGPTPTKTPIPIAGGGTIQCGGYSLSNSYNDPLVPPYLLPPNPTLTGKMCAAATIRSYFVSNADMAFGCGTCCRHSMFMALLQARTNPSDPLEVDGPTAACVSECMSCTDPLTQGYWPNRWTERCLTPACGTNTPGINQCFHVDQDSACPAVSGPFVTLRPIAVPVAYTDPIVVVPPNPVRPVPPWLRPTPPPGQGVCCYRGSTGSNHFRVTCEAHCPTTTTQFQGRACVSGVAQCPDPTELP